MYLPGQVIYDLDKKVPVTIEDVWDIEQYPKRHTHFIKNVGTWDKAKNLEHYRIATPKTIKEAEELLVKNLIAPSPEPPKDAWKLML